MRIAILGYGKMGKAIEESALQRGHEITLKISSENADFKPSQLAGTDVAIEFSLPDSAVSNIYKSFEAQVPVVVGTTGWYDHFDEVKQKCKSLSGSLLYATNFSIGVNIFFSLNKYLANLMAERIEYNPSMKEIHHTQKLDSPSGTAITLANDIITSLERKKSWVNKKSKESDELEILSERIGDVPGTHTVVYDSEIDEINITHKAKNRKGFAEGAVIAAEWLKEKKGIYTMKDMLGL